MAYDEDLAERVRNALADQVGTSEKRMFGGVAFMVHGNMAVGVSHSEMMVRAGDGADSLLSEPGVRLFEMSGKTTNGWLLVDSPSIAQNVELARWIGIGVDLATSLPPR